MLNKRNTLFAALAALGFQCMVSANDIEPGKEFYTAIKAPAPIVLDGDLSEWRGAALLADPRFSVPKGSGAAGNLVFFEEYNGGTWTGPDDQTSAVQVMYDDDNVYFGFTVTDEYHENSANSAWNGDSVQLMIANAARDQQIALYNYALGGIETELGDVIVMHEAGPATGADVPPTEAVIKRNTVTKRTIYEIKLPKESLGLEALKGGVRFGLGMAINDGDKDTPGQKGWGGLGAHSIVFGKSPGETALVTLAISNDIEPGKEHYTANPAPGAIVLDGELNDWKGVPVLSDPRFSVPKGSGRTGKLVLFEEYNGGTWTGPDDQTSAVQIAYDADNIYFGFVVTDEYHENSANSAWNGDSIQLMIANANQDQQIALYNYALGGVEEALGDVIVMHEAGPAAAADAVAVTEAVIKRNTTTKRTTYEIKLPKSTLGLESLALGTQFGLGMAINDGDKDTPGQKGWGGLGAHSIVFGKSPGQTALVTLGVGGGSSDVAFLSAVNVSINSFSFRASDKGDSIVNASTAKLLINGKEVALVASPKNVDATDFSYTTDAFEPNTEINYLIEITDGNGNLITDTGKITSPSFGLLKTPMLATNADTSKPGFLWRIWQSELFVHNTLAEADQVLAAAPKDIDGSTLANDAYADEIGGATGAGKLSGHLMQFEIPSVINLNAYSSGLDLGTIQPDFQMPGVPGSYGSYDGVTAEILTFIDFPAGMVTMGVNSDDGFRLEIGYIGHPEVMVAGQFNGARGSGTTTFLMDVRAAGVYPVRVVYYSGGGDASIELFTLNAAGEPVLVNDTANGGLRAYRQGTVPEYVAPPSGSVELASGLTAYWSFDGNLTEPVGGFNGTARGTAPVGFGNGKTGFGKALDLDGSNFVEITGGDNKKLQFPGGSMSIGGWFKVGAFDKDWQALLSKGEGSNYRIARRGGSNAVAYAGGVGEGADDAPNVNDGNWHHFVALSDATAAKFGTAIYIDGTMYGVNAAAPVLADGDKNLFIGENPEALNRRWVGSVDDIAIWNRVLTPAEVAALYNDGTGLALSSVSGVPASAAGVGIARTATGVTLTFEGTLQSSDSIAGPFADVPGASSPATIPFAGTAKFFRTRN